MMRPRLNWYMATLFLDVISIPSAGNQVKKAGTSQSSQVVDPKGETDCGGIAVWFRLSEPGRNGCPPSDKRHGSCPKKHGWD
jgi:hypothetical protein